MVASPDRYIYNETENIRSNGEKVWVVWLNQPVFNKDNQPDGMLCIGFDRTDLKRSEELREIRAKEEAAAVERNRLARELHDAVSQTLFSASLIAEVLPAIWSRNPPEGQKRLQEIRELTRGALAEMRTLLLELRPSTLIESELGLLLKQLGESMTGRMRIPVSVEVTGSAHPPVDVKVVIYRVTQEALNNAAKHSAASQVKVSLVLSDKEIRLTIEDNGSGFKIADIKPDSLGIGIMQERSDSIGALLNIVSHPGQGTRLELLWKNPE
jgi:signal transduction histidine kinase